MKHKALTLLALLIIGLASSATGEEITWIYHISPKFMGPIPADSDASKFDVADAFSGAKPKSKNGDAFSIFEALEITLTEEGYEYDKAKGTLTVTLSESDHEKLIKHFDQLNALSEKQIHITVEFIEVEHMDFSDWLLSNRLNGDGTPLRKEVQEWIRDDRGRVIDTTLVVARSGQRAKTESVSEYIYPTETTPIDYPNELTLGEDADPPEGGIYASAYETRNLGTTFEVDPVIGRDELTIDLNLAPEIVTLEGFTEWFHEEAKPEYKTVLPMFHALKVTTQVTLIDGRYQLLSASKPMDGSAEDRKNPLVLIFVRADLGISGAWWMETPKK